MKKILVMMLMLSFVVRVSAKEFEHRNMVINDSTLTISQAWDGVMRWVVSNEDKYGMRIAYQNPTTGSIIVKGEFRDTENSLQCVRQDFIRPVASFTIEINCSDNKLTAEMTEANYEYRVGYGSAYSVSTFILKWCKQEMEEIERIMRYKGEKVNCYDSYFEETASEYDAKNKEAETIEKDETASKKERKKAKKYLEDNRMRKHPYLYVKWMPTFTARELFYGEKGLSKYIAFEK